MGRRGGGGGGRGGREGAIGTDGQTSACLGSQAMADRDGSGGAAWRASCDGRHLRAAARVYLSMVRPTRRWRRPCTLFSILLLCSVSLCGVLHGLRLGCIDFLKPRSSLALLRACTRDAHKACGVTATIAAAATGVVAATARGLCVDLRAGGASAQEGGGGWLGGGDAVSARRPGCRGSLARTSSALCFSWVSSFSSLPPRVRERRPATLQGLAARRARQGWDAPAGEPTTKTATGASATPPTWGPWWRGPLRCRAARH